MMYLLQLIVSTGYLIHDLTDLVINEQSLRIIELLFHHIIVLIAFGTNYATNKFLGFLPASDFFSYFYIVFVPTTLFFWCDLNCLFDDYDICALILLIIIPCLEGRTKTC